ncbi:heterokaryon incompatibility protein-domain-containing protein [Bisporella sp. PMI_857]|nr:heterokaryon incompatibility protein-domain-containing protein [Bisporella sp. PMI_857]
MERQRRVYFSDSVPPLPYLPKAQKQLFARPAIPTPDRQSPAAITTSSTSLSRNGGYDEILYHPLDHGKLEFRLLVLEPGFGNARLKCRIIPATLRAPPVYTALSYAWEAKVLHPTSSQKDVVLQPGEIEIDINGNALRIGSNLGEAMRHLRDRYHPQTLWIDAVCIDQNSTVEKNHQVELMRRLYRHASHVVAWLGPDFHQSSRFLDLVLQLSSSLDQRERVGLIWNALHDNSFDFQSAFKSFFRRTYWYRTWIIQEIFSAGRIYIQCGTRKISWSDLVSFYKFLTDECCGIGYASNGQHVDYLSESSRTYISHELKKYVSYAHRFRDISTLRSSKTKSNHDKTRRRLDRLLFDNWDAMASDPKDKVFAIFRMASDSKLYNISLDYDLTVREVYINVVQNFVRIYRNLSIILPKRPQHLEFHLPSWCPDLSSTAPAFDRVESSPPYPFEVSEHARKYCAAGPGSEARVRFSGQSMYAYGWRADRIRSISTNADPPYFEEEEEEEDLSIFSCLCFGQSERRVSSHKITQFDIWYAMHRRDILRSFKLRQRHGSKETFSEYTHRKHHEFWHILIRATTLLADDSAYDTRQFRRWRENRDVGYENTATYPYPSMDEVMTPVLRRIVMGLGGIKINERYSCFFLTQDGHMGLGPRDMQSNDVVCILQGCGLPLILRWNGLYFRLIGPAYVVGFMHGWFITSYQTKYGPREEEFEIC